MRFPLRIGWVPLICEFLGCLRYPEFGNAQEQLCFEKPYRLLLNALQGGGKSQEEAAQRYREF